MSGRQGPGVRRREAGDRCEGLLPGLVFGVALIVYWVSLCPTLYWGDGAGWIAASATVGVPSSSGCPFYLLLGRLLAHVPWGELPWRYNLLSALSGAACVAMAYAVGRRALTDRLGVAPRRARTLALAGAGMTLFGGELWLLSATAELYVPVAALVLGAWCCATNATREGDVRPLLCAGLLVGLGLAVHPSALFALPALAVLLWRERPQLLSVRLLAGAAGFALTGVLLYVYLPVVAAKDPAINWGDPDSLVRFWRAVSGADFAYLKGVPSLGDLGWRLVEVAFVAADGMSLVALLLGSVGLATSGRRLFPLALLGAGNVGMVCLYRTSETASYLVLPQIVCGVFAAAGLARAGDWIGALSKGARPRLVAVLLGAAAVAGVAGNAVQNFPEGYKAMERSGYELPRLILAGVPEGSVLLSDNSAIHLAVDYLQWVEGERRDVVNAYGPLLQCDWVRRGLVRRAPGLRVPAPTESSVAEFVRLNETRRCVFHLADARGPLPELRSIPCGPLFSVGLGDETRAALTRCARRTRGLDDWESALAESGDEAAREFVANVYLNRAQHALSLGRLDSALQNCLQAAQAAPQEAAPWASLGSLLSALGREQESGEALRRARRLAPWEVR